ncbi:MAG TPA: DNA ligase D [Longimicrobiaceae bacterium]|nr:DNA ligase D [Longimicrobiaceae bacterium]
MAGTRLAEYRRKRDFRRTPEPRGTGSPTGAKGLAFVVQKHAASHLHYDLRLEVDGVMKSWAVPRGPSLDPAVKRLAVEVEDHPMEYNAFEGTIPKGEYGGGTVMLWDRGTYAPDDLEAGEDPERAMRAGLRRGKLSVTFHGERLRGSWALVRTRRGDDEDGKPQWLLIKHEDPAADAARDLTAEATTSVATGRSMEEIAAGKGGRRTWRSNRSKPAAPAGAPAREAPTLPDASALRPMLATSGTEAPEGAGWTFEPKYDGIRVLAFATPDAAVLLTRNGNDKARQFPEAAEAARALAAEAERPVVLDGEVVAVSGGRAGRFGELQGRMHLEDAREIRRGAEEAPVSLVAFDLLVDGDEVLLAEPWTERRAALEALLGGRATERLWLGETEADPDALARRARAEGWEGIVAKRTDAAYEPGRRSSAWRKLKLENTQEFVVGGWTEPRNTRQHIGALLLGYYDPAGKLVYAGHTGTGLTRAGLADMARRLRPLERKTPPFSSRPQTNQPAHWVTPRVVVEVRFNEWTADGKLRQPVFRGVRDDKDPKEVVREPVGGAPAPEPPASAKQKRRGRRAAGRGAADVVEQVAAVREGGGDGVLELPEGRLEVSSLGKTFFPRPKRTKGDLLDYYARMSDLVLPAMQDRPLVLRRFPDGIRGEAFYQQSAPESVPPGVRVEALVSEEGEPQRRFVGGNLATLLYTVQLGAVSYDPWHSRVGRLEFADYTILDLDPGPGAGFRTVVQVARWIREELDGFGLHGALKTSGSSGLHVYLPLPPKTPLEAATLVAQIVATRVAALHPEAATVERMTRRRPKGTVYVDYLQNILGKTVAGVYAVRAKPGATVSTPLRWDELTDDLDFRAFTIDTVPERVAEVGDLWAEAMRRPNKLAGLLKGKR